MTIRRILKIPPYTNSNYSLLEFCNLLDQLTITQATILHGEVACDFLGSMPNSFVSLVMEQTNRVETMQEAIGLFLEEGMRRKNDKYEEDYGFLGAFYGSISKSRFKKSKTNEKYYRCGIYGHFTKKCMAPHPTQENNVVQQAKLVQNEMLQLF
jgi:hypothetical protein